MIDRERLAREFETLVSIDAPSYGEREMADYLKGKLQELGFSVTEDRAGEVYGGNCGNLYARRRGHGNPVLLSMHMDTVEPSKGKQAVFLEDGKIKGNGKAVLGADDMSGTAAVLEALKHLAEEKLSCRDVELVFSIGEEKHVKGLKVFDASQVQAKESFVLDMDGKIGMAAVCAPSQIAFEAKIYGKASHAGFAPEDGVHAIRIAARAVARMPMGRIGEDTTVNAGQITGGKASNIVPDYCMVSGELRSFSHEKALAELDKVEEIFREEAEKAGGRLEFSRDICYRAYHTPEDAKAVQEFVRACESLEIPCELVRTFGGSDQNKWSEYGIPGIVLASAMHQVHSTEEWTDLSEMEQLARIVAEILQYS